MALKVTHVSDHLLVIWESLLTLLDLISLPEQLRESRKAVYLAVQFYYKEYKLELTSSEFTWAKV